MKIILTWNDIDLMCNDIAEQLIFNNYKIDIIVPLVRGGMFPGGLISEKLNIKKVEPLIIQTRDIQNKKINHWKKICKNYKNILIVDDIVDSGKTFEILNLNTKKKYKPNIIFSSLIVNEDAQINNIKINNIIRSMTINKKFLDTSWVDFPWEKTNY